MITQEVLDFLASLEKRLNKKICCQDCIKLTGCTDNQIAIFDSATGLWVCGDFPAEHDMVTLDLGVVTQEGANLTDQVLELVAAGAATYGLVKLEDLVTSIAKFGDVQLTGDVTLSAGSNITLTQVGNDIEIAAAGSAASVISPAQITADQDNYNPAGFSTATMVRLDFDTGGRAITGFAAGTDGQKITLSNISANFGYYPGSHPDSSAGNRILVPSDFIHYPYTNIDIVYDGTSAGWRIIGEQNTDGKKGLFYSWSPGSVVSGDWGDITTAVLGTGTIAGTTATTSVPASTLMSTSTSATSGARMYFAKTAQEYAAFGAAHLYAETLISIPTLSDGTETFTVELQLTNDVGSTFLERDNSVALRYSSDINGGEWELFSQDNAGAESVIDCNVPVAAATLYKLRIEHDKSNSEVRAYINGVFAGRVTASMPSAVVCGARVIFLKSNGTTARTLNVHSFSAGAIYT